MKLIINNKTYRNFTVDNITLKYNSFASSFSFTGLDDYSPLPLEYPTIEVYDDRDVLLLTGKIINNTYKASNKKDLIPVTGYSLPGVLEDCSIPEGAYPLEFDNMSLAEITGKLLPFFNIEFSSTKNVVDDMKKKYEKVTYEPGKSVKEFLNGLAKQRGIYITSTPQGKLSFRREDMSKLNSVAYFFKDGVPKKRLIINGQKMHSSITVMKQASIENPDSGEFTISNPYVDEFRPITKILSSGDIFDVEKSARLALSAELRNIRLQLDTTKYVEPGNLITLRSGRLRLKEPTLFFVEETIIKADNKGLKYTLNCVLKDVYTLDTPENIFK